MSRRLILLTALVAVLALLAACTPGEPEFDDADQARAADRAEEPTENGDGNGNGEPPADATVLTVTAIDIDFVEDTLEAPAGAISIELTNDGRIFHDFAISELGDQVVVEADPGETDTGTVELDAGTYRYICTVPGHEAAGMVGELTVS